MGATKKQLEELFNSCEGLVVQDEYGETKLLRDFELEGFFDGLNIYKRKKQTNERKTNVSSSSKR